MKYLWRADYLQCKTTCDFSVSWVDCRCTLSAEAVADQTPPEQIHTTIALYPGASTAPSRSLSASRGVPHLRGPAKPHQ
ncbi:unnamed protein product, partial [Ectocarpus sp. 8 AP-2014]